ncbi:MAG: serine/threonine protein kinase [Aquimonas sp.]|nr:serine/threonine protein kinase [Aquimonas sp.]
MQATELETWKRLEALLDAALEQPAAEREAWLAAACPEPTEQARLRALIAHAEAEAGPLESLAARLLPEADEASHAGREIGGYRLESLLGEGGMAVVWRASREVGGQRREVALKCLRRGLLSPELRQRFIEEQAILARLEHPHIARLYDAGVDPEGTPWIAMERVEGSSLVADADARRLDTPERVAVFLKVVAAVAHAHGELVVHRDLKPANILVDPRGEPRLLDFGIARLLEPGREHAATTVLKPLTPEYASPEQLAGEPIGVRSDLYSLGLVLHELLCGERAAGSAAERERAAPSTALRRSARADALAAARRRSAARLRRELRGDLDLIVQRCLRIDPARRYGSAGELAEDLRRWQQRRPLHARQGHRRYRLQRFLQRNWLPLGAGLSIAVALLLGSALALQQAQRAEQARADASAAQARAEAEAERAGATSRFLVDLFRAQLPGRPPDELPSTRELLDRGLAQVRDSASGRATLRADLMVSLGEILLARRQFDEAQSLATEAASLVGGADTDEPSAWARVLHLRADLLRAQRRYLELREALDEAIGYVEQRLPEGPSLFELLRERGVLESRLDDLPAAERRLDALHRRIEGRSDVGDLPLRLATDRANVLAQQGRVRDAALQHREILRIKRANPDTSTVSIAVTVFNLGYAALAVGEVTEAAARLDETLALLAGIEQPIQVRGAALQALSRMAHWRGDFVEAEAWLQRSADEWARAQGLASAQQDSFIHFNSALLWADAGRADEALAAAQRAIERMQARGDAAPVRIGEMQALRARLLCEKGAAPAVIEAALAEMRVHATPAGGIEPEARCAFAGGRIDAALELLDGLYPRPASSAEDPDIALLRRELLLAEALKAAGRSAEAGAVAEECLQRLQRIEALPSHPLRARLQVLVPDQGG